MQSTTRFETLVTLVLSSVLATVGCSGSSSGPATSCDDQVLEVYFAPMYSAYDGVPTHRFQIPAIVNGVASSAVTWSASDSSMVSFAPDTATSGTMITVLKSGTVNIIASAGTLCGSSVLTIDAATSTQWDLGETRYQNGEPDGGAVSDAGGYHQVPNTTKCTLCHGQGSTGPFMDVAHTPQQTGGFSDSDLEDIFRHGIVPDGGYFDSTIVSQEEWAQFHQWDMSDDEAQGIIVYLRSLTPTAQNGSADFGGHGSGGPGGPPADGGYQHRDGGFADGGLSVASDGG